MKTLIPKISSLVLSPVVAIVIAAISSINVAHAASPITNQAGFSVQGNKIINNATGGQFIPVGYNSWGDNSPTNQTDLSTNIPESGANSARIFSTNIVLNNRVDLVQEALQGGLVPIITEPYTGGETAFNTPTSDGGYNLEQAVNEWTQPADVALLQANPDIILNIGNEWGPTNSSAWATGYETAIAQLRAAGINNLLSIDSGDYGQDPNDILNYAQQVEASDPLASTPGGSKVAFAIHMYNLWTDGTPTAASPYTLQNYLPKFAALNVPVIVEEFGNSSSTANFNPGNLVQEANQLGLGWEYWLWTDGTVASGDPNAATEADLSNNPAYGLKALSKLPQYNLNTSTALTTPEPVNILGTIAALSIGGIWKRKLSKRKNPQVNRGSLGSK